MSSSIKIIAKSNGESLEEHTKKCLDNFIIIKEALNEKINYILNRCNIDDNNFWIHTFYAVAFHDFGKLDKSFQDMINKVIQEDPGNQVNIPKALPHALISAIALLNFEENNYLFDSIPISSICVLTHHSMLKDNLFERNSNLSNMDLYDYSDFISFVNKEFKEIFNTEPYKFNININKVDYKKIIKGIHNKIIEYDNKDILRIMYIIIENIIHMCDWNASSNKSLNMDIDYDNKICMYLQNRPGFNKLNELQIFMQENHDNYIIQSPTGSGKTEASLLWSKYNNGRIVYILPTMVTSNKIFERLKKMFGDIVGIQHSTSVLLMDTDIDADKNNYNHDTFARFYYKTFSSPIMVSTVDQLLYSLFNINRWDSVFFNSAISNVIFDEIHAYDAYTTSLIIEYINKAQIFNQRVLIMSATIPDILKDFIKCKTKKINFVDKEFDINEIRYDVNVIDDDINNSIDIIKKYKDVKKILVIANTIKTAKYLYSQIRDIDEIKDKKIVLFHSQFTYNDRKEKSELLETEDNIIAIATQVVEVSLDIDFDLLITQIAPPDALIQRFGRVNRRGEKGNTRIFIYKNRANDKYIYKNELMKKTFDYLKKYNYKSNRDSKTLINEIYNNKEYEENLKKVYTEVKNKIYEIQVEDLKSVYKFNIEEQIAEKHDLIRKINYIKILCIPDKYYNEVFQAYERSVYEGWKEFLKYSLNIPYESTKGHIKTCEAYDFKYFDFEYTFEEGVNYDKINIESNII
jgi:CRISPR-associated endonuclease/helicase Cas3